jgi:nucleotide-binding universal stress UspA family protein
MRTIADVMTKGPLIIDAQQSPAEARNRMEALHMRHLPVIAGARLVGILNREDVARRPDAETVADVMSHEPYTVAPDASVERVAREMMERRIDAAVVVAQGRIVGIFTAMDALHSLAEREKAAVRAEQRWPTKILCPIDFSDGSRDAVRLALDLARQSGASVTLFHGYALPLSAVGELAAVGADGLQRIDQETEASLRAWRDEALVPDVEVHTAKGIGSGADTIVRHAADHGFDLVVIGTHGRTGVKRVILGSVAEAVVRKAPCPVLVARRPE